DRAGGMERSPRVRARNQVTGRSVALITLSGVNLAHGGPRLLDGVSLQIDDGERLGLLGRDASGKSTLMALIAGELDAEGGSVQRRQGLSIARLPQDVPRGMKIGRASGRGR